MRRALIVVFIALSVSFTIHSGSAAQQADIQVSPSAISIQATTLSELRAWDAFVTAGDRAGTLRLRSVQRDPLLPARVVERYDQFHNGVRIWGADIVRDSERGVPHSIFGMLSPDLTLSVEPSLIASAAREALLQIGGSEPVLLTEPELVILRLDNGGHRLAYTAVVSGGGDVDRVFIDAQTGVELMRYSEIQQQQAAVGTGTGVLGDLKKVSVASSAGGFVAVDRLRPPTIQTFDLGGGTNGINLYEYVSDGGALGASELARDADNLWTDPAVIDAQAHIGMTYDYFYKRFGRSGIDDRDGPINIIANVLSQEEAPSNEQKYWNNANWCSWCFGGQGRIWFGNGLPPNWTSGGKKRTYYSGALDIVAHELTHAVTSHTSNLIYRNESGALNEAFSDMMGKSVEFFFHPPGSGIGEADYVIGKDVIRASRPGTRNGLRSMENPGLYGDPDHYSRLYRGTSDAGGVHRNSGIPNQAFYLAIESGTNRTSGVTVEGVGAANREQIEKVFFRAFTVHMPANATFSTARSVTAQAAQELYGAGGAVERAVTEAWSAVGVFERAALSFAFSPSPVPARTTPCGTFAPPCWPFRVTVQESNGIGFSVTTASIRFYNADQTLLSTQTLSFRDFFNDCGSASSRIPPGGTACADVFVYLGGRASGYLDYVFGGRDDNGNSLRFRSPLLRLSPSTTSVSPTEPSTSFGSAGIDDQPIHDDGGPKR